MDKIIHNLFHMIDEWTDHQSMDNPEMKELLSRQGALQDEIIHRLGDDGRDMMEALSNLTLKLEDIHDQALFRAAMQLGTQIAQPRRSTWAPPRRRPTHGRQQK